MISIVNAWNDKIHLLKGEKLIEKLFLKLKLLIFLVETFGTSEACKKFTCNFILEFHLTFAHRDATLNHSSNSQMMNVWHFLQRNSFYYLYTCMKLWVETKKCIRWWWWKIKQNPFHIWWCTASEFTLSFYRLQMLYYVMKILTENKIKGWWWKMSRTR